VLIGGIIDVVGSFVLGLIITLGAMSKLDLSRVPKDQVQATVAAALYANRSLQIGLMVMGLGFSLIGGYIAAAIAKHDEILNGGLSTLLCLCIGIYVLTTGKDMNPAWMKASGMVLAPAMALLGGFLRSLQTRGKLTA
jgi:hypothetical protein